MKILKVRTIISFLKFCAVLRLTDNCQSLNSLNRTPALQFRTEDQQIRGSLVVHCTAWCWCWWPHYRAGDEIKLLADCYCLAALHRCTCINQHYFYRGGETRANFLCNTGHKKCLNDLFTLTFASLSLSMANCKHSVAS